jgi:hypothetical protein
MSPPTLSAMVKACAAALPWISGPPPSGGTETAATAASSPAPVRGRCQDVPPDQCPVGSRSRLPVLPGHRA